ncbi:MAG TPA: N-acetyl-gamma-glutamyl-phosphate reductase [Candidatus Binatia bacterium]|nr:N-acetyl-gamma-glutamyl-phosphate reductase [Candidatus Binatia bacterium]
MISVGIVGGTGYTGAELLRLLARHPQVHVRMLTSRQEAGRPVEDVFPQLRGLKTLSGLRFVAPDAAALGACQAVFFATPHGTAMQHAPVLLDRGVRVVDLSADFRLKDVQQFQKWYGMPHASPQLLEQAVYGLPEMHRDALRNARLAGCAGCYPTAVQLGLLPLVEAGIVVPGSLIADCKSGVSGAGRELKQASLFSEAAESMKAYGLAGHRHQAEIEQGLGAAGRAADVLFVPHLAPMVRGIHATLYATLGSDVDVQALYERRYAGEPFVDILPPGAHPDTRTVRGSNHCRIAVHRPGNGRRVVVLSVIDNLTKGAAGQAVQCFNLMHGLPETAGLEEIALWP